MSNLKLYKGINNIDDDLIEEADCKQKPVIHHCYVIAASAATLFIAVGTAGVIHIGNPVRKPVVHDNDVITEESTTENPTEPPAIQKKNDRTSVVKATTFTAQCTVTSTQPSVSDSKTNQTNSPTKTTAVSAVIVQTEVISKGTVNQDSSDIQNYDFEYEGSIIMKKYAAALAALTAASSTVTSIPVQADKYEPEISQTVLNVKQFIEENDIDVDLNSDGNFDIFDVYAMYRCEAGSVYAVPDYISEKYESMPKQVETAVTDDSEFYLNFDNFAEYFFTYYGIKLEYFDPNYYIDNCPDKYNDPLPLDVIKENVKDIKIWNNEKFYKTLCYVKNEDETFRPFSAEDVDSAFHYNEKTKQYELDGNFFGFKSDSSPIHNFISDFKSYSLSETIQNNALMKALTDNEFVDTDINSDGVYDFDDIVLIAYYLNTYIGEEKDNSFYYQLTSQASESYTENYPVELRESPDNPITENEWNKACSFFDTARYYFDYDCDIIKCLAENYLLENKVDPKYFDAVYYEKNHLAHYEYDNFHLFTAGGTAGELFNYLGFYENFSFRCGPGSDKNKSLIENSEKNEFYDKENPDTLFPKYYKDVKTGVIAEPDMDLDGKIGISDYVILDSIDLAYVGLFDYDTFASFVRRYPEVQAGLNISQEACDNYKNNFDFNNNGMSCDFVETECMRMYIFGELESQYGSEEALCDAIYAYRQERPEMNYHRISYEKMEEFLKNNNIGFTLAKEETDENNSISAQTESAEEGVKGDSNVDGDVDISDSVLIMQAIANPAKYGICGNDERHITQEGYTLADVDGKGVTNMDALTIQKYLLGLCSIE